MPVKAVLQSAERRSAGEAFDPRIDAYIAKAQPFAQPILEHLRQLLHKAVPQIEETIKWSHAFFEYRGRTLANMAGFKQHCSLGFWGQEMTAALRDAGILQEGAMGSLGRISSREQLPSDKQLVALFKLAAAFIDKGEYTSVMAGRGKQQESMARAAKPPLVTPPDLAAALKANPAAEQAFAEFSPSCRREYIEWLTEAKREETRQRRLAQAVAMIAEGKQRHWKYQSR